MNIESNNSDIQFNSNFVKQEIKTKTPNIKIKIKNNINFNTKCDFNFKISNIIKIKPELENLEVTPTTEEQSFKSEKYGFENVKVKAIPEEYIVPKVIEKTLVLSRVNVDEGRLIL